MTEKSSLTEYRKKRNFKETSEPAGTKHRASREPIFVIQEHDARTLHYDFRIEVDGVLKSWAVPKGPSTDPRERRLAIPTEDHPMDYADFEGIIPEGQYGAGAVIVWDCGTYRNLKEDDGGDSIPMTETLKRGHGEIWLEGKKLRGGYALVRTGKDKNDKERWLLVKMKDNEADARRNPVNTERKSVKSGLTIKEFARQHADE